ncbi:A24 family peptidase [Bacillus tuaregi]|uniref:A24 family peptidase n=1 Tax=Bacillus tuaregi TaxID=1816695 RepID=UPI0008F83D02|nr:A24 family peptidase [Bacillus tuaregi]
MTTFILFTALIISFFTDVKDRRIFNIITFPAMIIGILIHTMTNGLDGLVFSMMGLGTGFALLIIPYALKGMAAGDVKLLMAIGALKGTAFVIGSFLYIAIAGGIIALAILIIKKELISSLERILFSARIKTLDTLNKDELHHAFPYGVAIVLGTIGYYGVNVF